MIINTTDKQIYLLAEPDKFLTDGEVICSTVIMPIGSTYDEWREINLEEKERMEAEQCFV